MPTATVSSKGQITLPRKVREALRVKTGDQVDFVLEADGGVRVRPAHRDVRDLQGLLHRPGSQPVTLAAMENAIARRGSDS